MKMTFGHIVLASACFVLVASASFRFESGENHLRKTTLKPVDDGDLLELLEPPIVPDPSNPGDRWWYTPSRKAHLYSNRFKSAIRDRKKAMLDLNAGKMGEDMRLPGDISPSYYLVQLFPFVELIESGNYTTDGYVEITFTCLKETRNISFNAAELDIDQSSLRVSITNKIFIIENLMVMLLSKKLIDVTENVEIPAIKHYDEQVLREIYTVEVSNLLVVGREYKLSMKFTAIMNDDLRGFYRSSYIEDDGSRKYEKLYATTFNQLLFVIDERVLYRWLAVSQMESTDARRAFPCFDEPKMKANFSIILGRHESMTSVSNMKKTKSEPM